MPLGMEVGDFVFDGDPAPQQKKGHSPHPILAHVCCGQTAGWIKMPLGTEVNLGPGHTVLDGDPAPPRKGHSNPNFGPYLLWSRSPISATAELLSLYDPARVFHAYNLPLLLLRRWGFEVL